MSYSKHKSQKKAIQKKNIQNNLFIATIFIKGHSRHRALFCFLFWVSVSFISLSLFLGSLGSSESRKILFIPPINIHAIPWTCTLHLVHTSGSP